MRISQILFGKKHTEEKESLQILKKLWPTVVGDSLASKSSPLKLRNNQLVIKTAVSSYSDMIMLKSAVKSRINRELQIKINEIEVRVIL